MENNIFDELRREASSGTECWLGSEMQTYLGYEEWDEFKKIIKMAERACKESGGEPSGHFVLIDEKIKDHEGTTLQTENYYFSRYACHLIAMNGDSSKPEIAVAQTYFAMQSRKMELIDGLARDYQRVNIRNLVKISNNALVNRAEKCGVKNFAYFHDAGYKGLYGMPSRKVKQFKGIPDKQSLLDCVGIEELSTNLFKITQCNGKLQRNRQPGEEGAKKTYFEVSRKVRNTIESIGGRMPEDLEAAEPIKEIEKKLRKQRKLKKSVLKKLKKVG